MQRCPKCGYREGRDWPLLLIVAGLGIVYCTFILGVDSALKELQFVALVGWLLSLAGIVWYVVRKNRTYREYMKLHSSVESGKG